MPGNQFDQQQVGKGPSAAVKGPVAAVPGKQTLVQAAAAKAGAMGAKAGGAAEAAADLAFNLKMARAYVTKLEAGSTPAVETSDLMELRHYVAEAEKAAAGCVGDPRGREALKTMFQLFVDVKPFLDGSRKRTPAKAAAPAGPAAAAAPTPAAAPTAAPPAAAAATPAAAAAAPTPAAAAAPTPAAAPTAAHAAPIPSPDPLLPLPTTVDELQAKTGGAAAATGDKGPPAAAADTKEPALPAGATLVGDHATVVDATGKSLDVQIKRDGIQPTTRAGDGFEIHVDKDATPTQAMARIAAELKSLATTPRQGSNDLDAIYVDAKVAQEELAKLANETAGAFKGKAEIPDVLKGRDRAEQKISGEYGGESARLVDVARATVVFNSYAEIKSGIEYLKGRAKVVRVKDRFETPVNGYRDVLMNLQMSNGHVVELQLHLQAILDVKHHEGHDHYKTIRDLDNAAEIEKRPLTATEKLKRDAAVAAMKGLYDAASEKDRAKNG